MSLEKDFVSFQPEAPVKRSGISALRLSEAPLAAQYLLCLIMTGMATCIAAGFDRYEAIPNLSLIYVVPVVIGSMAFGLGPALFSSVLGALAYNFFFTEPRFSLAVADTANIWAITLLFGIGCITATIASMERTKATNLARHLHAEETLGSYARQMTAVRTIDEATRLTVAVLTAVFQSPATIILAGEDSDDLKIEGEKNLTPTEIEAARSAWTSDSPVAAGIYPFDESRFDFWPVTTTSDQRAIIGIAFDPQRRPANPGAIIGIIALMFVAMIDRSRV